MHRFVLGPPTDVCMNNSERPLLVGIDIDGVLADYTSALLPAARFLGIDLDGSVPPTRWSMVEPGWFDNREDWKATHAEALRECDTFSPIGGFPYIAEQTHRLRSAGHTVIILTAREAPPWQDSYDDAWIFKGTREWLDLHSIGYDELRFDGTKTGHQLDVLLDDAPHNITEYQAAGERVVIFDQPYNRHLAGERVGSLSEFVDLVLGRGA